MAILPVRLKNGSEEVDMLVKATMLSLRQLMDNDPIALYELVMLCRDSKHELFGDTASALKDRRLVESNGKVHESIRNIVLSAVGGDGFDMRITSPLA